MQERLLYLQNTLKLFRLFAVIYVRFKLNINYLIFNCCSFSCQNWNMLSYRLYMHEVILIKKENSKLL